MQVSSDGETWDELPGGSPRPKIITGTHAVVTMKGGAPWATTPDGHEDPPEYLSRTTVASMSFSGSLSMPALKELPRELCPTPALTEFRIKPGKAWFFPGFCGPGQVVNIDDSDEYSFSFAIDGVWQKSFKNRLAPIVFWLWRYPWYPVRWMRWQLWGKKRAAT